LIAALALYCFHLLQEPEKAPPKKPVSREKVKTPKAKKDIPLTLGKIERPQKREPVIPEIKTRFKVAILIDDIGQDMDVVDDLLAIDAPLSFAVLPHLPHSKQAAEKVHKRGREILLHLPMEPKSFPETNPGPGALFAEMTDEEIRALFRRNLEAVPHVQGVNNHMGSRFTEEGEKLAVVLQEIKNRGFYFVDSRTSANSKGRDVAKKIGVRFRERNIFIDNEQDYEASLQNIMRILRDPGVTKDNTVLLIGHPYPSTVLAIREAIALLRDRGVEFVPVSSIVSP